MAVDPLIMSPTTLARIWTSVEKTDYCWNWVTPYGNARYPAVMVRRKLQKVSRLMYRHFNGPVPEMNVVRHTCDNTKCVNPAHLILGSQADNVMDTTLRNPRADYLPAETIHAVRAAITAGGRSQQAIADSFKIPQSLVSQIKSGKRYGWVE